MKLKNVYLQDKDRHINRKKVYNPYKKRKKKWFIVLMILVVIISSVFVFFNLENNLEEKQRNTLEGDLIITKYYDLEEELNWIEIVTGKVLSFFSNTDDLDVLDEPELHEFNQEVFLLEIDQLLDTMSLDDKVAQLMITTPEELTGISQVIQAGEATKKILMNYPVGGLLYSTINFETNEQLQSLINTTKIFARYPMFYGLNEEAVIRVSNTNIAFGDVFINLIEEEGGFLPVFSQEEDASFDQEIKPESISIVNANHSNIVKTIKNGAHMVVIKDDFYEAYESLRNAIKNETISVSVVDEKLRDIFIQKTYHTKSL